MSDRKNHVVINDELTDPIGSYVFDYLLSQTKETTFHDFKWTLDVSKTSSDFPKIMKDIFAFANYGGGYLVLGVKQNDHLDDDIKGSFVKVGLQENFEMEPAVLQEKINSYFDVKLSIGYATFTRTVNGEEKKFALIYIPPSPKILIPTKDGAYNVDGKERNAFLKDVVYTRRGTQSIAASDYEIEQIKKRLKNEEYRLSILNGEPEQINEKLYSNLFEIKTLPKTVYIGTAKYKTFVETIDALRKTHPDQVFFNLKYRPYEDKIITFQNLSNQMNVHSELVYADEIHQEPIADWLDKGDKERIIISLLNKEIVDKARSQGLRFDENTDRLFYPTNDDERSEEWPTRYKGVQKKQVAKKMWAEQLKRYVFSHAAIRTSAMRIGEKFYLRLNLTMTITDDGRRPMTGAAEGTIITRKSYRTYNKQQLNNILFWINKLGDGSNILVMKDLVISNEPLQTSLDTGISWDIPVADLKQIIENFEAEDEDVSESSEDENYEF